MDISCVIPAFENPDLLSRCLTSVTAQTEVALEIIVSDDSRGDAVRALVADKAGLFPALRYQAGARTGNPVDNWNRGLDQARAPLRVMVHHDEYLLDTRYLRRAILAMADPGVAAVTGGVTVAPPSRFFLGAGLGLILGRPRWLLPAINWIGPTAALVFRAGHRFDPTLVQFADVALYRQVLATGRLKTLRGACVGSLGRHPGQITAAIDPRAQALAELRDLLTREPPAITAVEYALARAWWRVRSW